MRFSVDLLRHGHVTFSVIEWRRTICAAAKGYCVVMRMKHRAQLE